jgi:hypothetical protein
MTNGLMQWMRLRRPSPPLFADYCGTSSGTIMTYGEFARPSDHPYTHEHYIRAKVLQRPWSFPQRKRTDPFVRTLRPFRQEGLSPFRCPQRKRYELSPGCMDSHACTTDPASKRRQADPDRVGRPDSVSCVVAARRTISCSRRLSATHIAWGAALEPVWMQTVNRRVRNRVGQAVRRCAPAALDADLLSTSAAPVSWCRSSMTRLADARCSILRRKGFFRLRRRLAEPRGQPPRSCGRMAVATRGGKLDSRSQRCRQTSPRQPRRTMPPRAPRCKACGKGTSRLTAQSLLSTSERESRSAGPDFPRNAGFAARISTNVGCDTRRSMTDAIAAPGRVGGGDRRDQGKCTIERRSRASLTAFVIGLTGHR